MNIWVDADPNTDAATATATTDGDGNFFVDQFGIDLVPGLTIIVKSGATEKQLELKGPLSIIVDLTLSTASGELPDGSAVDVGIGGEECGTGISLTDNVDNGDGTGDFDGALGMWAADLSGPLATDCPGGIGANAGAQVFLHDTDGDATIAEPPQPPSFQASISREWVQGQGFASDTGVDIWIDAPMSGPATVNSTTDGGGNFFQETGVDLEPGMQVIVSDGTSTKTIEELAGPLSIMFDPAAVTASGVLPPGSEADVWLHGSDCQAGTNESRLVDNGQHDLDPVAGQWEVDFSAQCPAGLGNQADGGIAISDNDNDQTIAEPAPPASIQASISRNWVQGQSLTPDSPVNIWIDVPMAGAPTRTANTDGEGNFGEDSGTDLMPGMTIIVSDGTNVRTLLLKGPLSIVVDGANATASGALPAGSEAQIHLGGTECEAGTDGPLADNGQHDLDSVSGQWEVDLSAQCPGGLGAPFDGQIQLFDDDGDATIAEPPPPSAIQASLTNNWVQGQSLVPNNSVQIWIDTPMTNPPTATAMTDGDGNFFHDQIGIELVPGIQVTVSDGANLRTLVLEGPLSINVNAANASAAGTLPAGREGQIEIGGQECGAGTEGFLVDDGNHDLDPVAGRWAVDLSYQCPDGLGVGEFGGQIHLFDDDGDSTIAEDGGIAEPPPGVALPPRLEGPAMSGCEVVPPVTPALSGNDVVILFPAIWPECVINVVVDIDSISTIFNGRPPASKVLRLTLPAAGPGDRTVTVTGTTIEGMAVSAGLKISATGAATSVPAQPAAPAEVLPSTLAYTGTTSDDLFEISLMLIVSGAGLVAFAKRRRRACSAC